MKFLKVKPYCGICLLNRGIKEVQLSTPDPKLQFKIIEKLIGMFRENFNENSISAHLGTYRDRIIKEFSGCRDPYYEKKKLSNKIALKFLPFLREQMELQDSEYKKFRFAVLASIVGNSIEFHLEDQKIELNSLENYLKDSFEGVEKNLAIDNIQELYNILKKKKTVLFLTDNAGEIVFDTILINQLIKMGIEIKVAVKKKPVLNDATMEDAIAAGLLEMEKVSNKLKIITTETDHVGIILTEAPKKFTF